MMLILVTYSVCHSHVTDFNERISLSIHKVHSYNRDVLYLSLCKSCIELLWHVIYSHNHNMCSI